MMHRFPGIRFFVVLMIAAVPFAAFAAEPVGRQTGGGSTMDWQLNGSGHEKAQLRWVSPDGESGSIDFPSGKNVTLQIRDLGTDLVDGQYNYELRLVPKVSKDLEKKLQAARAANDEKAARKALKDAGVDPDAGVMSGTFTVQNGSFVSTEGTEGGNAARPTNVSTNAARPSAPIAVNDQVIPDDLIVQGSLCVGFDCVNNENFGFDTIRMKENNTRIKFEDTSTTAGFPTTDWQLTANDSASGGANKFSIEDITGARVPFTIEGGSITNSLYVDSTGRIGFRTSTPVLDLHIATSNTPGIRLEQNNSGGFTAQTWDIAGNEANFFVRDVTGGSRLPFRIRPNAPTSSLDIAADGDVGIGTASPNANTRMDISDSTQLKARIALTGQEYFEASNTATDGVAIVLGVNRTNNRQIWFGDTSQLAKNTTNQIIRFYPQNGEIAAISTDATVGKDLKFNPTGGNVGIGTSTPSSRLHVNGGDIRVSGGSFIDDGVTLNVPDYVFDDSYKLMSLTELENFIRENKHLPNVPNAANVKDKGLNLSQMQMRLLEKVEELTLYTLEQNKTITELKAQNDALAERLNAIEQQR